MNTRMQSEDLAGAIPVRSSETKSGKKSLNPKTRLILDWQAQVPQDKHVNAAGLRVALILTQHLRSHKEREADHVVCRSQGYFAQELKASRNLVQNGFANLVGRGHLEVIVQRGKRNEYIPQLLAQPLPPPAKRPPRKAASKPASPAVDLASDAIDALVASHSEEIEALRGSPEDARLFSLPDLFALVQAPFPEEKRAPLRGAAHNDFIEVIARGREPIELFQHARQQVTAYREKGREPMTAAAWMKLWRERGH